jgi:hypothetical protein
MYSHLRDEDSWLAVCTFRITMAPCASSDTLPKENKKRFKIYLKRNHKKKKSEIEMVVFTL